MHHQKGSQRKVDMNESRTTGLDIRRIVFALDAIKKEVDVARGRLRLTHPTLDRRVSGWFKDRLIMPPERCARLPKGDNLLPEFCRLVHHNAMVAFGNVPKLLRAGIPRVKAVAEYLRDHCIVDRNYHGHRTVVSAQVIFGGKTIPEQQMHRDEWHVSLGDIGQAIVWRKQCHPGGLVGISPGEIGSHTRAERFTNEINSTFWKQ